MVSVRSPAVCAVVVPLLGVMASHDVLERAAQPAATFPTFLTCTVAVPVAPCATVIAVVAGSRDRVGDRATYKYPAAEGVAATMSQPFPVTGTATIDSSAACAGSP